MRAIFLNPSGFIRAILSILIVGMGVSLGREGALKQTGAAIASKLSHWFSIPRPQQRVLVACAAGAGLAAAYNVPFGGAVFAVEVLLGTMAFSLIIPALVASFVATGMSYLLLPTHPTYSIYSYSLHLRDVFWAILVAPLLGLAAVLWVRAINWSTLRKPEGWRALLAPVIAFTILGAVAVSAPDILGNGKGLIQRAFVDAVDFRTLAILLLLKFLAPPFCLSTGVPGGLFTPTMTFGALAGSVLGHAWNFAYPSPDPCIFAILGSAGMLGAAMQGPISSVILIVELTGHLDALMIPVLIVVTGASLTTSRFELRSIYSAKTEKGMRAAEKPRLSGTAFDAFATDHFSVAASAAPFVRIMRRLATEPLPLFVMDDHGTLLGEARAPDADGVRRLLPLEAATAADLAEPSDAVPADMSQREELTKLSAAKGRVVPVVNRSGRTGRCDPKQQILFVESIKPLDGWSARACPCPNRSPRSREPHLPPVPRKILPQCPRQIRAARVQGRRWSPEPRRACHAV
jgi:CIC family chloride channel protein